MIFANAIYLWGLLGILLPIAIHLWSRKKVKSIKVGSTKLLQSSVPKQTSSIKLNELLLLFLRGLTLLLLVFILAEPAIRKVQEKVAISYVIEADLIQDERISSILDTIPKEAVHLLDKGFPKWEDYDFEKANERPSYWQLAHEMQFLKADSIIVFSNGFHKGLKGMRPTIRTNTHWMVFEPIEVQQKTLAVYHKETFAERISISSASNLLSYIKDTISLNSNLIELSSNGDSVRWPSSNGKEWIPLQKNEPILVGIIGNDSLNDQMRYFEAAYEGIAKYLNRPVEVKTAHSLDSISEFDFATIVTFENIFRTNSKANYVIYQPDIFADRLITKGPSKNVFHLTRLLNSENILSEHLPERLLSILNLNRNLKDEIRLNDSRFVAENQIQPLITEDIQPQNSASIYSLTPWLWIALVLMVVLERILAKLRKQ